MESTAVSVVAGIVTTFPLLLAWFACALFAFTQWKKRPTAAKVVLAVCILSFIDLVCGQIYYRGITPMFYREFGLDYDTIGYIQGVVGFFRSCIHAFLFCLLVWGAFSKSAITKDTEVFS